MDRNEKWTWLLILQGFAILAVLANHAHLGFATIEMPTNLQGVHPLDAAGMWIAWYVVEFTSMIAMPVFFMISGYLFFLTRIDKNWDYVPMLKEKIYRLGIPYLFVILLGIIVKLFYTSGRAIDISAAGFIRNFTHPAEGAMREMWFIVSLLLYFLMFPIYRLTLKSSPISLFILLLGCGLYYLPMANVTSFLAINYALHFFVFFYGGMLIASRGWDKRFTSLQGMILMTILFIIGVICKITLLERVAISCILWGLAVVTDRYLTRNIFRSFRDYTYQIYLIGIFGEICVKLLYRQFSFPGSYILWWGLCIIAGIYLPVAVSRGLERSNTKIAGFLRRCLGLGNPAK